MTTPTRVLRYFRLRLEIGLIVSALLCLACAHTPTTAAPVADQNPQAQAQTAQTTDPDIDTPSAPAMRHYLRARVFALNGQVQAAVDALRLAVSHAPEDAVLQVELARLLIVQQHYDAAGRHLRRAAKLRPGWAKPLYLQAEIAYMRNQFDEARAILNQVLSLQPGHAEATRILGGILFFSEGIDATIHFYETRQHIHPLQRTQAALVQLYILKDDRDLLVASIARYLEADPGDSALLDEVSGWYMHSGRIDVGRAVFSQLTDVHGESALLRVISGEFALAAKDDDTAAKDFARARTLAPYDDDISLRVALAYLDHQRFEQAILLFSTLVEAGADRVALYYWGRALKDAGRCADALPVYDRLTPADNSAWEMAQTDAARCLRQLGQHEQADERIAALLNRPADAAQAMARLMLAVNYWKDSGQLSHALNELDAARKRFPDEPGLLMLTGWTALLAGKLDLAEQALDELLALDPYDADALNLLAYAYADSGSKLARAEKLAWRALSIRPGDGAIIDTLGWIYFKRGNLKAALHWLKLASLLLPSQPEVLLHLALALRASDRHADMQQILARAAALDKIDARVQAVFAAEFPKLWPAARHAAGH